MSENPVLNLVGATTDYNVNNSAQILAPNLTITDSDGGTLDGAKVTINNKSDGDFLGIAGQTGTSGTVEGLNWSYDENTGVLTLSGDADNSTYEKALQQVTYGNTSSTPDTTQRDVQFSLGSKSINPDNGHFYEYVEASDITWTAAESEASNKEYLGLQGYLATITSSEEQEFIENDGQADENAWIGASDATAEGNWRWVTGPEAGTEFWSGDEDGTAVGNEYNNWSGIDSEQEEPNNLLNTGPDGEDYAHIQGESLGQDRNGKWNDLPDNGSTAPAYEIQGYLVEYGGLDGDPVLNISGNVAVNITNSTGDDTSTTGDDTSTNGDDTSTNGDDTSTNGDDTSTTGDDTSTTGDDTSTTGDDTSTTGDDTSTTGDDISTAGDDGNPSEPPTFSEKPAILWRDFNAGNNEIWEVNYDGTNTTQPFSIDITNLRGLEDTNWRAEGIEDFNKDGIDDILWRNYATGENTIWLMKDGDNGIEFDQEFTINTVPGEQLEIENLADVTGDGTKDIIWRNYETSENAIWQINYNAENTEQPFSLDSTNTKFITPVTDPNWKIVESGDFNNDNISDILWHNDTTGENAIWLMQNDAENGSSIDTAYFLNDLDDLNWKVEGVADFNQDGNDDILWRNYSTGENAVWLMEDESSLGDEITGDPGFTVTWQQRNDDGSVQTALEAGSGVFFLETQNVAWDIEGVADYTEDGTPDILWRNYETGENAIWVMGSDETGVNLDAGYFIDSKTLEWQIESPTTNNDYVPVI